MGTFVIGIPFFIIYICIEHSKEVISFIAIVTLSSLFFTIVNREVLIPNLIAEEIKAREAVCSTIKNPFTNKLSRYDHKTYSCYTVGHRIFRGKTTEFKHKTKQFYDNKIFWKD